MIVNLDRFEHWKEILDRFEAGELIDTTASKMLQDLRDKERKEFEESCPTTTKK
jgi:hypothetical protein